MGIDAKNKENETFTPPSPMDAFKAMDAQASMIAYYLHQHMLPSIRQEVKSYIESQKDPLRGMAEIGNSKYWAKAVAVNIDEKGNPVHVAKQTFLNWAESKGISGSKSGRDRFFTKAEARMVFGLF